MERKPLKNTGYAILSEHRSRLMGIAMLWIMLYHAFPLVLPVPLNAIKEAGYCGADMFIFLSAMGQTLSSLKSPRPYGKCVARRVARILPAFYLVAVPFYLWKRLTGQMALRRILANLTFLAYWLDTPGHFNWYIPALLAFYLLAPLALRAVPKSPGARDAATVCVIALDVAACELLMRVGCAHLLDFFARIPVFWLGVRVGYAVYDERKITRRQVVFWALLFVLGALYYGCAPYAPVYLCRIYAFLLTTVPLCLFLCALMQALPVRPLLRLLDVIGACTLEIYLINATWFIEFDFFSALLGLRPAVYCLVGLPLNLLLGVGLHYGLLAIRRRIGAK